MRRGNAYCADCGMISCLCISGKHSMVILKEVVANVRFLLRMLRVLCCTVRWCLLVANPNDMCRTGPSRLVYACWCTLGRGDFSRAYVPRVGVGRGRRAQDSGRLADCLLPLYVCATSKLQISCILCALEKRQAFDVHTGGVLELCYHIIPFPLVDELPAGPHRLSPLLETK